MSPGPVETDFILGDIDSTADITVSQPMSSPEQIAQAILDLCGNTRREAVIPRVTGFLSTLTYLWPWIGRQMRPVLERKGRRFKEQFKAAQKKAE